MAWVKLRDDMSLSTVEYLRAVNAWWHQTPWTPYHLHWDDQDAWPSPWELLADNIFCNVSRGLGIMYTLALSPRNFNAVLFEADTDNLVQVEPEICTLNYDPNAIVNISLPEELPKHHLTISQIQNKLAA